MRQRACLSMASLCWALATAQAAHAANCNPATGISPCIDANALWLASGDARFFTLPSGETLGAGKLGLSVAVQALWRPLHLNVPAPNADGRDIRLVARAIEQDTTISIGLGRQLELGVSLPLVLNQSGSGSEGLTSQRAAPLDASVERDPRVSLSVGLRAGAFKFKPRVTLALPFGNADAYASAGSVVLAPAVPVTLRHGRFEHALELGLRLRRSVELGGVRLGSEASIALGTSFEVLREELLLVCAEAFVLPSLIDNQSRLGKRFEAQTRLLAAEYLISIRSRPSAAEPWTIAVGAGSALALSRESSTAGELNFVAPPGPALRVLAEVRYAPR